MLFLFLDLPFFGNILTRHFVFYSTLNASRLVFVVIAPNTSKQRAHLAPGTNFPLTVPQLVKKRQQAASKTFLRRPLTPIQKYKTQRTTATTTALTRLSTIG